MSCRRCFHDEATFRFYFKIQFEVFLSLRVGCGKLNSKQRLPGLGLTKSINHNPMSLNRRVFWWKYYGLDSLRSETKLIASLPKIYKSKWQHPEIKFLVDVLERLPIFGKITSITCAKAVAKQVLFVKRIWRCR